MEQGVCDDIVRTGLELVMKDRKDEVRQKISIDRIQGNAGGDLEEGKNTFDGESELKGAMKYLFFECRPDTHDQIDLLSHKTTGEAQRD